jgi:hypothetical protein
MLVDKIAILANCKTLSDLVIQQASACPNLACRLQGGKHSSWYAPTTQGRSS